MFSSKLSIPSIALALACCSLHVHAQVVGSTLSGSITDPSGGAIPVAHLEIQNTSTGVSRQAVSNEDGNYVVPNLEPGAYTVTIKAPGFLTQVTNNVVLEVGVSQTLNVAMQLGSTEQTVSVTDAQPMVDLGSSAVTDVIRGATVRELPLNGRDWTQLATLQPGVTLVRLEKTVAVGADRGNRGYGAQLTVAGGRPQQNNYRVDGISINDYSNGAPGSVLGLNLGVDAIQEFSVVTANASAEYGREAGGVVNAVTRAGTNEFHGTAYEFLRNSALDARNFFDKNIIPPFRRNQFGAALGGPVRSDRTFFFADFEGLRQSLGFTQVDTVPSVAARTGMIHSATGALTPVAVDPGAAKYLGFYPLPNGPILGNGDTANYSFIGKQVTPEDFATARIDQNFSQKDWLHGTYFYDRGNFNQPDSLNNYLLLSHTARQLAMAEETHGFGPALVNSLRFGVSRNLANISNTQAGPNALAADTSLGAVPGTTASSVVLTGLTTFGGGLNAPSQYNFYWTSIQAYDDAFYTRGRHTLRMGLAFERMRNNIVATSSPAGLFTFSSLTNFLQNVPLNFSAQLPGSVPERGLRQTLAGGYALDDWKLRPNLTLNIGLRYEATTVPAEVHGNLSTLLNLTDPAPHLGSPYFSNPTLKNFEPRAGLTWDPFGNGKTSIRAAFGIFDVQPLLYQFELLAALAAPYLKVGSIVNPPAGTFPYAAFPLISASPTSLRMTYIQPNPPRDYLMEWNINVQRSLASDLAMTLGYVGSRGVHQPFRSDDVNTVVPVSGLTWPSPAGSGTKLNPSVGQIAGLFWSNNSYYHGLQVQLKKRMSHGLQAQVSYTYSKAIDGGSATLAGDPFGNSVSGLFYFSPSSRRAVADFDVRQNLFLSYTWNLPAVAGLHGVPAAAVNGWELAGIFTAATGLPFTPLVAGDPLGLKNTAPYDVPDRLKAPGCNSGVNAGNPVAYIKTQCFAFPNSVTTLGNAGRNPLFGPGLVNFDISALKNFRIPAISELFNLQFRAEMFNILNRANFGPPLSNKTIFSAAGAPVNGAGQITSTVTTARQVQFGLKVIF